MKLNMTEEQECTPGFLKLNLRETKMLLLRQKSQPRKKVQIRIKKINQRKEEANQEIGGVGPDTDQDPEDADPALDQGGIDQDPEADIDTEVEADTGPGGVEAEVREVGVEAIGGEARVGQLEDGETEGITKKLNHLSKRKCLTTKILLLLRQSQPLLIRPNYCQVHHLLLLMLHQLLHLQVWKYNRTQKCSQGHV